jgi:hypothetical protein
MSEIITITITQDQIESLEHISVLMYDKRYKNLFYEGDVKKDEELLKDLEIVISKLGN